MNIKSCLVLTAVAALSVSVWAQDAEQPEAAASTSEAESKAKEQPKATFTTLPLCRHCEGVVEVQEPGGEWTAAEEGKFYPLGSAYRTRMGGQLTLAFGRDSFAKIEGEAAFATRADRLGVKSRTVILKAGRLVLQMPDNLPENSFYVTSPGFTVGNLAGESRYDFEDKGDGELATVRCVTGSLSVNGRHFSIPKMLAANEVEIRSSHDLLFTSLFGRSGDCAVRLERGECIRESIGDDGKMTSVVEKQNGEWKLSPMTKVVIRRAKPDVGERMSVFIMCFDTTGNVKSQCSYCEGRGEINSGEMIRDEKSGEEFAKRAAEASQTSEAAATTEDAPAEEEANKTEEKSDEE